MVRGSGWAIWRQSILAKLPSGYQWLGRLNRCMSLSFSWVHQPYQPKRHHKYLSHPVSVWQNFIVSRPLQTPLWTSTCSPKFLIVRTVHTTVHMQCILSMCVLYLTSTVLFLLSSRTQHFLFFWLFHIVQPNITHLFLLSGGCHHVFWCACVDGCLPMQTPDCSMYAICVSTEVWSKLKTCFMPKLNSVLVWSLVGNHFHPGISQMAVGQIHNDWQPTILHKSGQTEALNSEGQVHNHWVTGRASSLGKMYLLLCTLFFIMVIFMIVLEQDIIIILCNSWNTTATGGIGKVQNSWDRDLSSICILW